MFVENNTSRAILAPSIGNHCLSETKNLLLDMSLPKKDGTEKSIQTESLRRIPKHVCKLDLSWNMILKKLNHGYDRRNSINFTYFW